MSTSLYEPNFLASLKDDSNNNEGQNADPDLRLPPPPPPQPPSYPTALVPPAGPPYQPWEDPRYALAPQPAYRPVYIPQQHYHPLAQQHQHQPAPTPEYYAAPPPPAHTQAPHPNTLPPMLPQGHSPYYMQNHQGIMHMQQHGQQFYPAPPVNVPAFRPSNFAIPPLRRNQSGHNSGAASPKRPTPALPPRQPAAVTPARHGLYEATYSNVQVYEMASPNGVGVMRRKHDSWMNATHILKAAGMEKSKRTKVLEREIHSGEHEKIQGGYGKYQGTWIPLYRARELAAEYGLAEALSDILDLPE